ncbi:TPA: hypothetical protein NIM19_005037 [Klebsiella variicola subsp. variicola]|nr:hypothetical protein [Klebsiella variicola subsp. variicola]
MELLSLRNMLLSLALILPMASNASDASDQPSSSLSDGVETFSIACFGMPQQTTIDMDACLGAQLTQVEWVKDKYLVTAQNRLKQDNKDGPQHLQELTTAFEAENKAWTDLIERASASVKVDYAGGTIVGSEVTTRKIGLYELQVHDIWEHWLRFEDSTPPLLPEPKFKSDQ